MAAERFEDRLRRRAANMRALASMPGASGPLRVWIELPVDDADRLADLVAAAREDFEHHDHPDGSAEWLNRGLELRRVTRTALAALDEAASRG